MSKKYWFSGILGMLVWFAQAQQVMPSKDFKALTDAYFHRPVVSPNQNAFIYLSGIMTSAENSPIVAGQRWVEWANQKIDRGDDETLVKPTMVQLSKQFQSLEPVLSTCRLRSSESCRLSEHIDLGHAVISDNQWLLQRYRDLLDFSSYQNTQTIDLMMWHGTFPERDLQALYFTELWLNRLNYSSRYLKTAFEKDYRFHLMRAQQAQTLVERAKATVMLQQNYYWLNELLKSLSSTQAAAMTPDYLHQSIPRSVLSMRNIYIGELVFFMSLFKPQHLSEQQFFVNEPPESEKQHLFNEKATLIKKMIEISEATGSNHEVAMKQLPKAVEAFYEVFNEAVIRYGEMSEDVSIEDLKDMELFTNMYYIMRLRRLAAVQKAVRLLAHLRSRDFDEIQIREFFNQPEYYHPLTQQPFIWDEIHGYLEMEESDMLGEESKYYLAY